MTKDELETMNPMENDNIEESKKKIASIKVDIDSLKVDVDSLKQGLASLRETVNSVKSTLDLLPTKEDLIAIFTSLKEPAKRPAASVKNNVIPVSHNSSSLKDQKESEEPALKKAKVDTNTLKKESSSNVLSKESDEVEKELTPRPRPTLFPCSSGNPPYRRTILPYPTGNPLDQPSDIGERVLYTRRGRYDCGTIFVKGYDTSLPDLDIKKALLEHFSPCGMVKNIYFHRNGITGAAVKGYAFTKMLEGVNDALKLNGSDMGGYTLEVDEAEERDEYYNNPEGFGPPSKLCGRHRGQFAIRLKKSSSENSPVYGIVSFKKINKQ